LIAGDRSQTVREFENEEALRRESRPEHQQTTKRPAVEQLAERRCNQ
jgi:hypothetical protein